MIANGVMLSIQECEMLLELVHRLSYEEYKKMTPQQLDLITGLRSVVRDDPIGTHIQQYHD